EPCGAGHSRPSLLPVRSDNFCPTKSKKKHSAITADCFAADLEWEVGVGFVARHLHHIEWKCFRMFASCTRDFGKIVDWLNKRGLAEKSAVRLLIFSPTAVRLCLALRV